MKIRTSLESTADEIRGLSPGRGRMSGAFRTGYSYSKAEFALGQDNAPLIWGCVQDGALTARDATKGSCLRKGKQKWLCTPH